MKKPGKSKIEIAATVGAPDEATAGGAAGVAEAAAVGVGVAAGAALLAGRPLRGRGAERTPRIVRPWG